MLRYLQDPVQPVCVVRGLHVGVFSQHELFPLLPAVPPPVWFEDFLLLPLKVTVSEVRETIKIAYLSLFSVCRGFVWRDHNISQPCRLSPWSLLFRIFAFSFRGLHRFCSWLGLRYPDGRGDSVDLESFHKNAITRDVGLAFKLASIF